jgi:16S rRNA (uracil1498-N3)-methyltransferase
MRERRFLIPRSQWRQGRAYLGPDESRHAERVLRLAPGAKLSVVDGEGGAWFGLLAKDGEALFAGELHPLADNGEPRDAVTLGCALAKGEKLDVIAEKATECGVFALQPLLTERSEAPSRAFANLRPRLEKILQSALQQSGRSRLPALADPRPLAELHLAEFDDVLFGHPGPHQALAQVAAECEPEKGGKFLLLIGPEGGFSESECAWLVTRGAKPFSLGPRILRAETAGPIAVFTFLSARGAL